MRTERVGTVCVLTPDHGRALSALPEAARAAIEAGAETLLVDLGAVRHPRGDEIDHLVAAAFACEKAKRGLALAGLSPEAARAISLLGLEALFPYVYADRADALARLKTTTIAPPGEPPLEIGF
jgi:anti-anti-sigma regulatory factor